VRELLLLLLLLQHPPPQQQKAFKRKTSFNLSPFSRKLHDRGYWEDKFPLYGIAC
jgi:hypothetical protein